MRTNNKQENTSKLMLLACLIIYFAAVVFADLRIPLLISAIALSLLYAWMKRHTLAPKFRDKKTRSFLLITLNGSLSATIAVILISFFSSPTNDKDWDLTLQKQHSISSSTKSILRHISKINTPITVKAYLSRDQESEQFYKLTRMFLQESQSISFQRLDPDIDVVSARTDQVSSTPTLVFEGPERRVVSHSISEESIARSLQSLVSERELRICFLSEQGEARISQTGDGGISQLAQVLTKSGLKLQEITNFNQEDTSSCTVLVSIGPQFNPSIATSKLIQDYLANDGKFLLAIDAIRPHENWNRILKNTGISLNTDMLILGRDDPLSKMYGQDAVVLNRFSFDHPATRHLHQGISLISHAARSLSLDSEALWQNEVLIASSHLGHRLDEIYTLEDLKEPLQIKKLSGNTPVVAYSYLEKAAGIVIGTSQIGRNQSNNDQAATVLLSSLIGYLADPVTPFALSPASHKARGLQIDTSFKAWFLLFVCFGTPLLWLLLWIYLAWRRRKKQSVLSRPLAYTSNT